MIRGMGDKNEERRTNTEERINKNEGRRTNKEYRRNTNEERRTMTEEMRKDNELFFAEFISAINILFVTD